MFLSTSLSELTVAWNYIFYKDKFQSAMKQYGLNYFLLAIRMNYIILRRN